MKADELLDHLYTKRSALEQKRNALSCEVATLQRRMNEITLQIAELEVGGGTEEMRSPE